MAVDEFGRVIRRGLATLAWVVRNEWPSRPSDVAPRSRVVVSRPPVSAMATDAGTPAARNSARAMLPKFKRLGCMGTFFRCRQARPARRNGGVARPLTATIFRVSQADASGLDA